MQQHKSHKYRKWWPIVLFLSLLAWPAAARSPLVSSRQESAARGLTPGTEAKPFAPEGKAADDGPPEERSIVGDEVERVPPVAPDEIEPAGDPPADALLVNKKRPLPADYEPPDLRATGIPFACPADSPKRLLRAEAVAAIERLVAQAAWEQVELVGVSAYRSFERQREIFAAQAARHGEEEANRVSARPGESEHQTGLAIDVSSPAVGGYLVEALGETEAGRWLARNAPAFGFIIRYPAGKEDVTGYQYEPWHLRYVGVEHARRMAEEDLTLEEYLAERGM